MRKIEPLKIDPTYRNTYHFSAPFGWINDPNGLCEFQGKIHLFYQHNPYSENWDTMHWGHATTKDFVKYEHEPIALYPSLENIDNKFGIFSGSILVEDGVMNVFYTGADQTQQTCFATSKDGINFTKSPNPIISSKNTPKFMVLDQFRDPYIFVKNNIYYILMGALNNKYGGEIYLYKSNDKISWQFVGSLFRNSNFEIEDGTIECPGIQLIDGCEVLLASFNPSRFSKYGYQTVNTSRYAIGNLNLESGEFKTRSLYPLDYGFDFYAPQMMKLSDGRTIMIAWINGFTHRNITSELKHGWSGTHTLARELSIVNKKLMQFPVKEIQNYYQNPTKIEHLEVNNQEIYVKNIKGDHIHLEFDIRAEKHCKSGIKFYVGETEFTTLLVDFNSSELILDVSNSGFDMGGIEPNTKQRFIKLENTNNLHIDLFLDTSCFEVFINRGLYTLTSLIFRKENSSKIAFFSESGTTIFANIKKQDIEIK